MKVMRFKHGLKRHTQKQKRLDFSCYSIGASGGPVKVGGAKFDSLSLSLRGGTDGDVPMSIAISFTREEAEIIARRFAVLLAERA